MKIGSSTTSAVNKPRAHEIEIALEELFSLPDDKRPTAIIDPWDSDMKPAISRSREQALKRQSRFRSLASAAQAG